MSQGGEQTDAACSRCAAEAAEAVDQPDVPLLVSGAGHDALAMAELTPIGMLFVRCRHGGISHSPEVRRLPKTLRP